MQDEVGYNHNVLWYRAKELCTSAKRAKFEGATNYMIGPYIESVWAIYISIVKWKRKRKRKRKTDKLIAYF